MSQTAKEEARVTGVDAPLGTGDNTARYVSTSWIRFRQRPTDTIDLHVKFHYHLRATSSANLLQFYNYRLPDMMSSSLSVDYRLIIE